MRKVFTLVRMLIRRDPLVRFFILQKIGAVLVPNYMFNWPHLIWFKDPEFNRYLEVFGEVRSNNAGRHWMLAQLLALTEDLSGDTAECGVFKGASSYLICKANEKSRTKKTHHCFDSFEGLSTPLEDDGEFWASGDLSCSVDEFKANLNEFSEDAYVIYRGWIPDRFAEIEDREFSFVHIDVDLFEPTRDSLDFFYPRMTLGGVIVFDDYGFETCPGASRAIREFMSDKPEPIISLSCGGAFIIKK